MAKQTIKQALRSPAIRRALNGLGCPVGGWAETEQARMRVYEEMPIRELRAYTLNELVAAALVEVGGSQRDTGRYDWRAEVV
jgi:hypothetical protein